MRRREFIALLGSASLRSRGAVAQSTPRVYRVGFLTPVTPIADNSGFGSAFLKGMAEHGYRLGKTSYSRGAGHRVVTATYRCWRRSSLRRRLM